MNIVDWLIVGVVIFSFALGYRRGLVAQLLSVVGIIAALLAAFFLYRYLSPYIALLIPLETLAQNTDYEFLFAHFQVFQVIYNVLAFAILFFVVRIGIAILKHFLNVVVKAPGLNLLNRWGGVLFALLEALLLTTLAIYIVMVLPSNSLQYALGDSVLVPYLLQWPGWAAEQLLPELSFMRAD
ncbi:CvpA family protein [Paenibacillus senegalensis]|uniref:CvpA family protein n=1 Tax=Paenibacillus senegalensis TaxID=1465766 RepID=UPI0012F70E14|nr:CvpA family protein [Paenibacillus senegalensis]